jgi:hypothetical protein
MRSLQALWVDGGGEKGGGGSGIMSDTMEDFKNRVCDKYPGNRQLIGDAFKSANINDEHKSFFRMFFVEGLKHNTSLSSEKIWAWYLGKENKKKIDERDSIGDFIGLYNSRNKDSFKIKDWRRECPDCICHNQEYHVWAIEHTRITRSEIIYDGNHASDIDQIIKLMQNRISRKDKADNYQYNHGNRENVLLLEVQPVINDSDLNIFRKTSFVFPGGIINRCFAIINLPSIGKTYEEIKIMEYGGG